jgi:hypothetical protein
MLWLVPYLHLSIQGIPPVNRACAYIIVVVVFRTALDQRLPESDVDSSSIFGIFACALGYRVQPVGLCPSAHQNHVTAPQWQFQGLCLSLLARGRQLRRRVLRRRLMFHVEISTSAQRETRYRWKRAQEPLVVAVIGDAVAAAGVIVHEAEVKDTAGSRLAVLPQFIEALRDGARGVFVVVAVPNNLPARLGVHYICGTLARVF